MHDFVVHDFHVYTVCQSLDQLLQYLPPKSCSLQINVNIVGSRSLYYITEIMRRSSKWVDGEKKRYKLYETHNTSSLTNIELWVKKKFWVFMNDLYLFFINTEGKYYEENKKIPIIYVIHLTLGQVLLYLFLWFCCRCWFYELSWSSVFWLAKTSWFSRSE